MSNFEYAIEYVLKNEKGLEENPKDPGGITKYGISLRFLKSIDVKQYGIHTETIDEQTIKDLTIDQAKSIYLNEFWNKSKFEELTDQDLANYIFDTAINMGISPAIKCLQRACWAVFNNRDELIEDGILGGKTLEIINHLPVYANEILAAMRSERSGDYRVIATKNPSEGEEDLKGWLNRAYRK